MATLSEHLLAWPGIKILASPAGSCSSLCQRTWLLVVVVHDHTYSPLRGKSSWPLWCPPFGPPISASVGKASELLLYSPSSHVPTPLINYRARTVRYYDQSSLGHVLGGPWSQEAGTHPCAWSPPPIRGNTPTRRRGKGELAGNIVSVLHGLFVLGSCLVGPH